MNTDIKHVMQFFAFAHLPAHLQEVSRPFGELAQPIADGRSVKALDHLLAAKDAAIRARLAKVV